MEPLNLARSLEGIVRCMSNNLQQLHHSFNFYFFTAQARHISSGLYLYPVFAMQLPLLSFLLTSPAYRDIRSLLVGLGAIATIIVAVGAPVFLLGTNVRFAEAAAGLFPVGVGKALAASAIAGPPACGHPSVDDADDRRVAVAVWLGSSAASAFVVLVVLRQQAFRLFDAGNAECEQSEPGGTGAAVENVKGDLRLPTPLWEAMRAASGFAYLVVLAGCTIYSWAVAVPMTIVFVPALVLAKPFSLRRRPVMTLLLVAFLAGNVFLLSVQPAKRAELLNGAPSRFGEQLRAKFLDLSLQAPPAARPYLPTRLVDWVHQGTLAEAMSGDLLLSLHGAAKDFSCVGGMMFPIICFGYLPFLALLAAITLFLPAQRVDDEGLSLQQLRLGIVMLLTLLAGAFVGAIYWRSHSSSGLGDLQW